MKIYTTNPYDYNSISLKGLNQKEKTLPSSISVITNPTTHMVGKWLGIDYASDWDIYYDKVFRIVDWAKQKTGSGETGVILKFLQEKIESIPQMNSKRINDLDIARKLDESRNTNDSTNQIVEEDKQTTVISNDSEVPGQKEETKNAETT